MSVSKGCEDPSVVGSGKLDGAEEHTVTIQLGSCGGGCYILKVTGLSWNITGKEFMDVNHLILFCGTRRKSIR